MTSLTVGHKLNRGLPDRFHTTAGSVSRASSVTHQELESAHHHSGRSCLSAPKRKQALNVAQGELCQHQHPVDLSV